jgi:hypothetical protein
MESSGEPRGVRRGVVLLCFLIAAALCTAKVLLQRADPPAWAMAEAHRYEGFVAIDRFAQRAELLRAWLVDPAVGGAELHAFLQRDLHPTTVTVPFLVAVVSCVVPSLPWSYVLVSLGLAALSVWLVGRLASAVAGVPVASPRGAAVAGIAGVLVAAHVLTARTCALLIVDWGVVAAALLAMHALLRWQASGAGRHALLASLALTAGLFTKVNALPLLAAPVFAALLAPAPASRGRRLVVAAAQIAVPLLAVWSWSHWLQGGERLPGDMAHLLSSSRLDSARVVRFLLEMVLLWQVLPWFLLRDRPRTPAFRCLLLVLATQFAATAAFELPVIPRLWLPVLFLAAPLVAAAAGRRLGPRWLCGYAAINLALGAASLGFG